MNAQLNSEIKQETITYIANPDDSRCSWWSMVLPENISLDDDRIPAPYLKKGADLELEFGDMLIDSESKHHRKNRGYYVRLGVALDDKVNWIFPTLGRKTYIKTHGGKDLMNGSGDVAGVVRMAIWLRRQPDLKAAFEELLNEK